MAPMMLWFSCRKDKFEDFDNNQLGTNYFPIKTKMYHQYKVKIIHFDAFNQTSDTLHLIERIEQDTFFKDNLGRNAMRIEVFTKDSNAAQWESVRSYYYVGLKTHVEAVIENKRNVILTLPMHEESVWDYNTYNNQPQYLLMYSKKMDSYSNGIIQAGRSMEITRLGRDLPFESNYWKEIYSEGIGLVSREYTNIEFVNNIPSGIKENKELIEYGYK